MLNVDKCSLAVWYYYFFISGIITTNGNKLNLILMVLCIVFQYVHVASVLFYCNLIFRVGSVTTKVADVKLLLATRWRKQQTRRSDCDV